MSGTTLKWIAVISMLIDHTAEVLINHNAALTDPIWAQIYVLMRGIGRIAFPIYAFLLVEGFLHTRDVKKYLVRGWLSQIFYLKLLPLYLFESYLNCRILRVMQQTGYRKQKVP